MGALKKRHEHIIVCKVLFAVGTKLFGRDVKGASPAVLHISRHILRGWEVFHMKILKWEKILQTLEEDTSDPGGRPFRPSEKTQ